MVDVNESPTRVRSFQVICVPFLRTPLTKKWFFTESWAKGLKKEHVVSYERIIKDGKGFMATGVRLKHEAKDITQNPDVNYQSPQRIIVI